MTAPLKAMSILVVEDVDHKFDDVIAVIKGAVQVAHDITRAKTLVEAADHVRDRHWDLVVLDISMDIAPGSGGALREGHANLGGMDILEQMFLLDKESPTAIVTGFDYFVKSTIEEEASDSHTITDLERQAKSWIGNNLLACIRYGSPGWTDALTKIVGEVA